MADLRYGDRPGRPPKQICKLCGRSFFNARAHDEECRGPQISKLGRDCASRGSGGKLNADVAHMPALTLPGKPRGTAGERESTVKLGGRRIGKRPSALSLALTTATDVATEKEAPRG